MYYVSAISHSKVYLRTKTSITWLYLNCTFVFLVNPERVVSSGGPIIDHRRRRVVDAVGADDAHRPHAVLQLRRAFAQLLRLVPRPGGRLREHPVPEAAADDGEHDDAQEEDDEQGDESSQVGVEVGERRRQRRWLRRGDDAPHADVLVVGRQVVVAGVDCQQNILRAGIV